VNLDYGLSFVEVRIKAGFVIKQKHQHPLSYRVKFLEKCLKRFGLGRMLFSVTDVIDIRCSTSGVAQRAMREAAPHARDVSKATLRRLAAVKI
jgi:hypothetical protein